MSDTTNSKPKTVTRKSITTDVSQYLNHRPLTARVFMLPSIHVNDVTNILLHRSHKCMEDMRLRYLKFPSRWPAGNQSLQKQAWFQDWRVKKFENESDSGPSSGGCGSSRAEIPTSGKSCWIVLGTCLLPSYKLANYIIRFSTSFTPRGQHLWPNFSTHKNLISSIVIIFQPTFDVFTHNLDIITVQDIPKPMIFI